MGLAMKKKNKGMGKRAKPITVVLSYNPGAIVVDSLDDAVEALTDYTEIEKALRPLLDYQAQLRTAATAFAKTTGTKIIPVDGAYWRKQARTSKYWVATDEQIPANAPKGVKSLKAICRGKSIKDGKKKTPLWNLITRRFVDNELVNDAVAMGYLTEKEVKKAYLESTGEPFLQRWEGVPPEDREDEE